MKNQLTYLNTVLTIIAVALTAIVLQNADIIPKAHAAPGLPYAMLPLNEKGELPVTISSGEMDVRVTNTVETKTRETVNVKVTEPISIKSDFYSTPLNVNIDKVGGQTVRDAIPVKSK